jgi:hypothetical protein
MLLYFDHQKKMQYKKKSRVIPAKLPIWTVLGTSPFTSSKLLGMRIDQVVREGLYLRGRMTSWRPAFF